MEAADHQDVFAQVAKLVGFKSEFRPGHIGLGHPHAHAVMAAIGGSLGPADNRRANLDLRIDIREARFGVTTGTQRVEGAPTCFHVLLRHPVEYLARLLLSTQSQHDRRPASLRASMSPFTRLGTDQGSSRRCVTPGRRAAPYGPPQGGFCLRMQERNRPPDSQGLLHSLGPGPSDGLSANGGVPQGLSACSRRPGRWTESAAGARLASRGPRRASSGGDLRVLDPPRLPRPMPCSRRRRPRGRWRPTRSPAWPSSAIAGAIVVLALHGVRLETGSSTVNAVIELWAEARRWASPRASRPAGYEVAPEATIRTGDSRAAGELRNPTLRAGRRGRDRHPSPRAALSTRPERDRTRRPAFVRGIARGARLRCDLADDPILRARRKHPPPRGGPRRDRAGNALDAQP